MYFVQSFCVQSTYFCATAPLFGTVIVFNNFNVNSVDNNFVSSLPLLHESKNILNKSTWCAAFSTPQTKLNTQFFTRYHYFHTDSSLVPNKNSAYRFFAHYHNIHSCILIHNSFYNTFHKATYWLITRVIWWHLDFILH